MAKASQLEIDNAIKLVHLLDATINTRPFDTPNFPDEEEGKDRFDRHDLEHCQKLFTQIRALSGGLMRVVFGFQVLVDNCCDPAADTLEWKPEIKAKLEAEESEPPPDPPDEIYGSDTLP